MKRLALTTLLTCFLIGDVLATDFEFISFTGHRFGSTFDDPENEDDIGLGDGVDWGFIVGSAASDRTRYELLYSHQDSGLTDTTDPDNAFDLEVHYLQLGGSVDISRDRLRPFVSGGVGMTYMNPRGVGLQDETHFSLSLGGGLKWYPTDRLGFRFEVRGYGTLNDNSNQLFCDADCDLKMNGDLLPQYETNLGLIFRF